MDLLKAGVLGFAGTLAVLAVQPAEAGFTSYVIRTSSDGTSPVITTSGGQTEFIISLASQKAGLGSNDINGFTLGSISHLEIDRLDNPGRFAAGSGPAVAPYLNFWITDGAGHYAVVANEPSDAAFQPLYDGGYDLSFADLANKVAKIYETSDTSWLPNHGVGLTFAALADYIIQAPTVLQLTTSWTGLGTGAPRELGTNIAYGVNWVFGDTLNNYVSGQAGYIVANALVNAPEPASMALLGVGLAVLGLARRRRAA